MRDISKVHEVLATSYEEYLDNYYPKVDKEALLKEVRH